MSTGRASPFNPKAVLALLLVGALAFLAMLYFIGAGETGRNANDGRAHAASKGITGYAGLARLLEAEGHDVSLSRNAGRFTASDLLILTPPHYTDAEELASIIEDRRYMGPTLVVLPKWWTLPIPPTADVEAEEGWTQLGGADTPDWVGDLSGELEMGVELGKLDTSGPHWRGLGQSGSLPDAAEAMAFSDGGLVPVISDAHGRVLAGYLDDANIYPVLDDAVGRVVNRADGSDFDQDLDVSAYNAMFVAEPDLFNNYGMADRERARLALELVRVAMEGEELGITFDLTLNGLGRTQNLLTLAFAPPFLAATLCLILAMIVVAWRAFRRFGPPLAEARAIEFGKSRLVANSAAFVQRTGRLHLIARPYADMMTARIARALGLRRTDESEIERALERRPGDAPSFARQAAALRAATTRQDMLRAARALKDIERTLKK